MHPPANRIRKFVEDNIDDARTRQEIAHHLDTCEFCAEIADEHRLLLESLTEYRDHPLPEKARLLAERLYADALRGWIIELRPLRVEGAEPLKRRQLLAADGEEPSAPRIQNLGTLYSEDPEIVLRIMRNADLQQDYLQLISDQIDLSSHVMVRLPDIDKEFITDQSGRATLSGISAEQITALKWQVKLPDAVFTMETFQYDPDRTEYADEVVLETDRRDRVKVQFEGKAKGKQVSISILELDGRADFGDITVYISQGETHHTSESRAGEPVTFQLTDIESRINIRLYQYPG